MSELQPGDPNSMNVYVRPSDRGNPLVTTGVILVAVVVLYLGAGIFVPLVLAVLLAFALAPLIRRFRHMHIPHILAVLLAVGMAAAVISTIGYIVATQLIKLASDLPTYQTTVSAKTTALQQLLGNGQFIESLTSAIEQLTQQFAGASGTTPPIPVTITNGGAGPLEMVQTVLGSVLGPLATAAIVLVFLIFLLLEREGLRDRFLKLVSRGDLRTSTKVMNEAAERVGRYLLVQFCVNLSYGTIFGIGLSIIGVPNAILWGLLAAMFRYIPFVGTIIAATIPFTLAFAVDPGWSMLLAAIALYAGMELVITNAIEPRLYGSSTGLSALAVLVAAMFWASLWGPIGLILSTPMTVCLVVIGRYVPQLAFFETLLGSAPVMSPPERLYQRLAASNIEEAVELADEFIAENDVASFYQQVAMPALRLAEADLSLDATDLTHRRNVVDSMAAVINDIDIEIDTDHDAGALKPRVVCIGGRTELDEAAAQILARLLRSAGYAANALAPLVIRQESIGQLVLDGVEVVCLCYLGDNARSYAKFVARRLQRRYPELKVIACAMGPERTSGDTQQDWGTPHVTADLAGAIGVVDGLLKQTVREDTTLRHPIDDAGLTRLRRLARSDGRLAETLGAIASASGVPVAIIDISDVGISNAVGDLEDQQVNLVSQRVIDQGAAVVIPDVAASEDFANDKFLLENGVRFYAGVPLFGPDGASIGALALLDHTPRRFADEDVEKLELQALRLMVMIAEIQAAPALSEG